MKNSEIYKEAIKSVIHSNYIENPDEIVDILCVLIKDYEIAVFEEMRQSEDV